MGSMSALSAFLLVAGLLILPLLYAEDGGGDSYSEPPAVENEAIILAEDGGGDDYSEPSAMENEAVILAEDGGGDGHGEQSPSGELNVALV